MKFLVCGGLGFIGSAFIRNHLANYPDDKIINLDNFSIGANEKNVANAKTNPNYSFIKESITNLQRISQIVKDVDIIVNFAAETHVDRSIANPLPFIETNVLGTFSLLEAARQHDKFLVHVSTDEVYGDREKINSFDENDLLIPSNPYSATKASADHLVLAYYRTYEVKCTITRCSNNFGPYQHPEKLIPKTTILALKNKKIPLHGGGNQLRNWIYVLDHVHAIEQLICKCRFGEIYNISSDTDFSVRSMAEKILTVLDKPLELLEDVNDRPGQDKQYPLNSCKIHNEIGWKPKFNFDDTLHETVLWYKNNPNWWNSIINDTILHPQQWTQNWK